MTLAIEAVGLIKRFGKTLAVDGVDLAVRPGMVLGLLGPNGAGKTSNAQAMVFKLVESAQDALGDLSSVVMAAGQPANCVPAPARSPGHFGEDPGDGSRVVRSDRGAHTVPDVDHECDVLLRPLQIEVPPVDEVSR